MKKDIQQKTTKKSVKAKREKLKYPNLNRNYNLKSRRDYVTHHVYTKGVESVTGEGEGIRALNEAELEWLNKFEGEYTNASVSQSNKDKLEKQLHNTKELAKDCTDRNNARNRDLLNNMKMTNKLEFRNWKEFDQNTIDTLGHVDLEFALAAESEYLLEQLHEPDDDTDDS